MAIVLLLTKFKPPSPKDAVWLKYVPNGYGEDFKFVNVFSLFHNYLPLEKGMVLPLDKHESQSPKDALCQVWLKYWPSGS